MRRTGASRISWKSTTIGNGSALPREDRRRFRRPSRRAVRAASKNLPSNSAFQGRPPWSSSTLTVTSGGAIRAMCLFRSSPTLAGSWFGTRRKLTLAMARAGRHGLRPFAGVPAEKAIHVAGGANPQALEQAESNLAIESRGTDFPLESSQIER